jgi:O-antigen chain-terminating methyltransferase
METPNGSNVLVGSNNFYLDPTHIRPVPAEFLQFVTETSGFVDSQIVLHRRVRDRFAVNPHTGEAWSREVHQALSMVEDTLLGAEDYAVVARRP